MRCIRQCCAFPAMNSVFSLRESCYDKLRPNMLVGTRKLRKPLVKVIAVVNTISFPEMRYENNFICHILSRDQKAFSFSITCCSSEGVSIAER
jgi:hypothetical protein